MAGLCLSVSRSVRLRRNHLQPVAVRLFLGFSRCVNAAEIMELSATVSGTMVICPTRMMCGRRRWITPQTPALHALQVLVLGTQRIIIAPTCLMELPVVYKDTLFA